MNHIGTRLGLTALILATLTVACQRSSPEVVVYTSEDQVFSEPILKDFEKRTGIKVRAVYDTEETKSTGVALRIVAERDRPQADVFWANEPLRPVMLQQQGLLEPYRSPNADDIPARYRDPDGYWTDVARRLDWMTPFTLVFTGQEKTSPSPQRSKVFHCQKLS